MSLPTLTPSSVVSAVALPAAGTSSKVNATLPYKIYSDESSALYSSDFLLGAEAQVNYVYKKLGGDVLDIELTEGNVYTAYEEAVLEYSYLVNLHQATNMLSDSLGGLTGSFDHKGIMKPGALSSSLGKGGSRHVALRYPKFEYSMTRRAAEGISADLGLNSSVQYSASFSVKQGVQDYDLQQIISSKKKTSATAKITISSNANLAVGNSVTILTTDNTSIVAEVAAAATETDTDTPKFAIGGAEKDTAESLSKALNANSRLTATFEESIVTVTQASGGPEGNTTIQVSDPAPAGISITEQFKGGAQGPYPWAGKVDGKKVLIKKVYYKTPHAMWRFYGYYGGLNVVGNLHNYGQFSDDSSFQLVPTWQNKQQALAFEDAIYTRMSHFSYELKNNKLRLFPIPYTGGPRTMYVEFSVSKDAWDNSDDKTVGGVNNMNTLPMGNLPYNNINAIGKQWIRRFALALCKEVLGQVRSKFGTVPVPGDSIQLNGTALITEGKDEQEKLRTELKETLAELTYAKLAEKDANVIENAHKALEKVPNYIFVG